MKYNPDKSLLTVLLDNNAGYVRDIIMGDPTVVAVDWLFINRTLQTHMGYALQIKLSHQYLVNKLGPNFDLCNQQLLDSSLTNDDYEYFDFLSSRQEKFNIQPYLTSIQHAVEKQIVDIGNMYQKIDDDDADDSEQQRDVVFDLYHDLFQDTFVHLLNNPELYTQYESPVPVPHSQPHQQQQTHEHHDNEPSRKRMRGD